MQPSQNCIGPTIHMVERFFVSRMRDFPPTTSAFSLSYLTTSPMQVPHSSNYIPLPTAAVLHQHEQWTGPVPVATPLNPTIYLMTHIKVPLFAPVVPKMKVSQLGYKVKDKEGWPYTAQNI